MLQVASPFQPDDQELSSEAKTQVQTCRLLSLSGAVLMVLLGGVRLLFPLDAADPVWTCFVTAGLFAGLFALTYGSSVARRYCTSATIGLFALVLAWSVVVAVLNRFSGEYAVGLLLVYAVLIVAGGLPRQSPTTIWWLSGLGPLLTVIGLAVGPAPQTRPLVVLGCMATAGLGAGLAMQVHLSIRAHLREREERLRAITENVSEGIYRSSVDEGLVYVNQTFADLFGYDSVAEVMEVDPDTLYPNAETREQLRRAVQGEDSFDRVEVTFQRKDGSTFIGLLSGSVVRDEDGNVKYYDGAITDITERKAQERRLRVLSEAVEQAEDGILITEDPSGPEDRGAIRYVNPAFEAMTGYSEEELLGETVEILRGPQTDSDMPVARQDGAEIGEARSGQAVNYRKDGTPFVVEWNVAPVRDEAGEIEYWTSIQRDVTERHEMEKQLREREARLRGLINSIPGVTYQFFARDDGTYGNHFVSDHAEDLLGLAPDTEDFYERFMNHVPPPHRAEMEASIEEAVRAGEYWRHEIPFETPSGERLWLLGTSTPEQRDGEIVFNGVFLDITERKEAEQAVQEERDRFETLFEGLPTPVVQCTAEDETPRIADVNAAFEDVFGMASAEAEGKTLEDLVAPEEGMGIDRQALTEGAVRADVRCEADDEKRDFRIQVAGRTPDTGPPEGHAIFTDVTERKRREQQLRRQNDLFAMAQDLANVGALEYDVEADELIWTDEVYRIHDLPKSFEPTPEKVIEYYHPEDRSQIRDMFARALEEGESYTRELRLLTEEEDTEEEDQRWVRTRGTPEIVDGEVVRLQGSIQDITERKRRERTIREANATMEAILENLPPGVLAEDASRRVLTANQSFCDLLGLPTSAADLQGQDASTVTRRTAGLFADPDAFTRRTQEIVERSTPVSEEELVLADGRILERDFVPYELEEGRAALWVYRDITERKERERRLKEAKEEAEEANRMKSVFLANMSHEIRTPLTSIIGFAEAIGDEVEAGREGPIPRFAKLIEKSGNRLLETLDAVLNLSKLEAGEMGLSPEPISLAEEVEEMGNLFGPRADEEEVDLQIDGSDESLWVQADPGGLRIALRNLISNAIKYTEAGGRVWVRTRPTDGRAVLEVEDTGIGMDPKEATALFEAFRQGSEGVSREYEGSGLGLAVTKRVLNQMDGTIDVETEKGEGTCFTVTLPLADVEEPEAAVES